MVTSFSLPGTAKLYALETRLVWDGLCGGTSSAAGVLWFMDSSRLTGTRKAPALPSCPTEPNPSKGTPTLPGAPQQWKGHPSLGNGTPNTLGERRKEIWPVSN